MSEKKPSPFDGILQRIAARRKLNDAPLPTVENTSPLAKRIMDAAARARGETPPNAPTAPTGMARKILDAAATRDSGGHVRPKPSGVAAEIIASGEKRRSLSGKK